MKMAAAMLAMAMTAGCATVSGDPQSSLPAAITYQTTPCFGFCPTYRVTIHADGTGTFVGEGHTAVNGKQPFSVTPAQYAEFARRLAPLRPASGEVRYDHGTCEVIATDMQTIVVGWTGEDGVSQSLSYDLGCEREKNRAMIERLRSAPDALLIEHLIHRPASRTGSS